MNNTTDSQTIELFGKNILINKLLASGIEVAQPVRDRGVDLIAYVERRSNSQQFVANPLQIKVFRGSGFSIDRKYSKISNLYMIYIWNVLNQCDVSFYAMSYEQAVELANSMGYTKTRSWCDHGRYVQTVSSKRLTTQMENYLVC